MAYTRNELISRAGYSGLDGVLDTLEEALGAGIKYYGDQQRAAGAAAAQQQQNRDLTAALMARQGIGTDTLLIFGALGVGAFLLLRKRKD